MPSEFSSVKDKGGGLGGLGGDFGIIEEGSEEEESSSDEEDAEEEDAEGNTVVKVKEDKGRALEIEAAQGFTHFTHVFSSKMTMVCDIQGVCEKTDEGKYLTLTDPAFHEVEDTESKTNRQAKGVEAFYKSHVCGDVCQRLGNPIQSFSLKSKTVAVLGVSGRAMKEARSMLGKFSQRKVLTCFTNKGESSARKRSERALLVTRAYTACVAPTNTLPVDFVFYNESADKLSSQDRKTIREATKKGRAVQSISKLPSLLNEFLNSEKARIAKADAVKAEEAQKIADAKDVEKKKKALKKQDEKKKQKQSGSNKIVFKKTRTRHLKDALTMSELDPADAQKCSRDILSSLLVGDQCVEHLAQQITKGAKCGRLAATVWRATMNEWKVLALPTRGFAPSKGWEGECREFRTCRLGFLRSCLEQGFVLEDASKALKKTVDNKTRYYVKLNSPRVLSELNIDSLKQLKITVNKLAKKEEDKKKKKTISKAQLDVCKDLMRSYFEDDVLTAVDEAMFANATASSTPLMERARSALKKHFKTEREYLAAGGQKKHAVGTETAFYMSTLGSLGFNFAPATKHGPPKEMTSMFTTYSEELKELEKEKKDKKKDVKGDDRLREIDVCEKLIEFVVQSVMHDSFAIRANRKGWNEENLVSELLENLANYVEEVANQAGLDDMLEEQKAQDRKMEAEKKRKDFAKSKASESEKGVGEGDKKAKDKSKKRKGKKPKAEEREKGLREDRGEEAAGLTGELLERLKSVEMEVNGGQAPLVSVTADMKVAKKAEKKKKAEKVAPQQIADSVEMDEDGVVYRRRVVPESLMEAWSHKLYFEHEDYSVVKLKYDVGTLVMDPIRSEVVKVIKHWDVSKKMSAVVVRANSKRKSFQVFPYVTEPVQVAEGMEEEERMEYFVTYQDGLVVLDGEESLRELIRERIT